MQRNTVPFEETLRGELQDRELAVDYLNALLRDGDEEGALLALRDIVDAMSVGAVAKSAGLNRESLYKTLSGSRDPRLGTFLKLLRALGLQLCVEDVNAGELEGEEQETHDSPAEADASNVIVESLIAGSLRATARGDWEVWRGVADQQITWVPLSQRVDDEIERTISNPPHLAFSTYFIRPQQTDTTVIQ